MKLVRRLCIAVTFAGILCVDAPVRAQSPNVFLSSQLSRLVQTFSFDAPDLEFLRPQVRSGSKADRLRAIQAVTAFADTAAYPELVQCVNDTDKDIRLAAATALHQLPERCVGLVNKLVKPESIDDAKAFLAKFSAFVHVYDPRFSVLEAPEILVVFGEGTSRADGERLLSKALKTEDPNWDKDSDDEVSMDQETLDEIPGRCGMGGPSRLSVIREFVSGRWPDLYLDYAERARGSGVGSFLEDYQGPHSVRFRRLLLRAVEMSDSGTRNVAVVRLGDYPDPESVAALRKAQGDVWAVVRLSASLSLASTLPASRWEILTSMTSDRSKDVRSQVAAELEEMKDPRTLPWAKGLLSKAYGFAFEGVVDVLAAMESEQGDELLADYLSNIKAAHREKVANVLADHESPAAIRTMERLQHDSDPKVVCAWCEYCGCKGDATNFARLRELSRSANEELKRAAKEAIASIMGRLSPESSGGS